MSSMYVNDVAGILNKISTKLSDIVYYNVMLGIQGQSNKFTHSVEKYIKADGNLMSHYVEQGAREMEEIATTYGWLPKKEGIEKVLEGVSNEYLGVFSILNEIPVVGVNLEKEDYPVALYTRSFDVLEKLNSAGYLANYDDSILNYLYGKTFATKLKKGEQSLVRLDLVESVDGKVLLKLTKARETYRVGENFYMLPLFGHNMIANELSKTMGNAIAVEYGVDETTLSRKITTIDPTVVQAVYEKSDDKREVAKRAKVAGATQYDILSMTMQMVDIESSTEALGIIRVRPEMLHSIKVVGLDQVDTSRHNVDFTLLRGIYNTRIKGAKLEAIDNLALIDVSSYATLQDKKKAYLDHGASLRNTLIYTVIKQNEDFFGNLEEGLEARRRVTSRFLKGFESVELTGDKDAKVAQLRSLMDKGVVKFSAQRKDYTIYNRRVSNNREVLSRMLGEDYVKYFESAKNRLYEAGKQIQANNLDKKGLQELVFEYDLFDLVDVNAFTSSRSEAGKQIYEAIGTIDEKKKAPKEGYVTFRSIDASSSENFYGSIDVDKIMEVEFKAYEAPVSK